MGWGEKGPPERKQRWEFIELNDFRATGFWTYIAYGWLWFLGGVGVAVYAVDTFTAVNLLIFDRWSSQVQPKIPFRYSKWIFAACIGVSWILCIYEWIRALRVIQRDGVAASYMDPVAMSLQSMRSRGFKRFLVFTELTKSKKGTDYVAFFVYFAFQGALRVIVAEGPRQVVNALTLYAVMQADLIDGGHTTDGHSQIQQFFVNIGAIADKNLEQALIYGSMLFTLVIWVFSAICLMAAGLLYIVFLWHYIPQRDGRLRIYCRRKIDRRLEKIVAHWVEAALEQEARKRDEEIRKQEKAEKKAELKRQKTGELPPRPPVPGLSRAPTLPNLDDEAFAQKKDDSASLSRTDTKSTIATLPLYSMQAPPGHQFERQPSLPDLGRQPSLPDLGEDRPPMPSRSGTQASGWSKASFESEMPLLPNAGFAGGEDRVPPSPAPTYYSRKPSNASFNNGPPMRANTNGSQGPQRPFTPGAGASTMPHPGGRFPVRSNTALSFDEPPSAVSEISPVSAISPLDPRTRTLFGPPPRVNTAEGYRSGPRRKDSEVSYFSRPVGGSTPTPVPVMPPPPMQRRPTVDSVNPPLRGPTPVSRHHPQQSSLGGRSMFSPAPSTPTPPPNSFEMTSNASKPVYKPFNPGLHSGAPTPVQDGPRRNITVAGSAGHGGADYFSLPTTGPPRSFTAPVSDRALSSYGSILDDYGAVTPNDPIERQPRGPSNGSRWQGNH